MNYDFFNTSKFGEDFALEESEQINTFILKNNQQEILKAIDFLKTEEKFLYIHGFMGTGKRQFINYVCEYLDSDVIKLEYYCKEATVCDDIMLAFTNVIDNLPISKAVNVNAKITSLNLKLQQQISSIKKPFLLILHSFDDIQQHNLELITKNLKDLIKESNIKLIISTRALKPDLIPDLNEDKKIFLKALSKEIFQEYLNFHKIETTPNLIEDFYKYTRGYYYYLALSVKIIQAMKISLSEFLLKFNQSGINFDSFLGITYINLIPSTIRNFFWFLRTIRHGLTLNALAIFELYDEFAIDYLKNNLMIFQSEETLYVQDYFLQKIDISIPAKTEIKLHKYIIGIYENQLKESLKTRSILISRQAFRAEIEYHNECIKTLENKSSKISQNKDSNNISQIVPQHAKPKIENLQTAIGFYNEKKYTESIEILQQIINQENIDLQSLVESRVLLAKIYSIIEDYSKSVYYYELVETYYIQHKELINLNYLQYDLADLYFKLYKYDRAIDTIKKVVYSVDTPQSLLIESCILIANIYYEQKNIDEAFSYYKKAIESINDEVKPVSLAELYFKFGLVNDDKLDLNTAYEYYMKCICIKDENPYRALAYSNLASCYLENNNINDALDCFNKAYEIENKNNNYDGIYYAAINIAKIYLDQNNDKCYDYLVSAKKSAEFLDEPFYLIESAILMGDYYYNKTDENKACLEEYLQAKNLAETRANEIDITKIESRIHDMSLRMSNDDFEEIIKKYEK